ncbi:MAG: hypothetical protein AAF089_15695 [Bacteroidota bacterium]
MLSSRAVLLVGALSLALLVALAVLGLHLTQPTAEQARVAPTAYAPDYLDGVADLDDVPLDVATDRFLDAVQQQYPTPESVTIDEALASAAVALAARLNTRGTPVAVTLSAQSLQTATLRGELLLALLQSAGLDLGLLRVDPAEGPPALTRRVVEPDAVDPGTTAPGTTAPGTTAPGTTAPDTADPLAS